MTAATRTKVGVIGLGSMGLGMAKAALAAGLDVAGYDVAEAPREALGAAGGRVAPSAGEAAADAEILVTVVVNAAQTERILFGQAGEDGAAGRMAPGGVVVSCATMAPADARRLAAAAGRIPRKLYATASSPTEGLIRR